MIDARFITAVGTPLTGDDALCVEGLAEHLDDQADAGIDGLLVAGTMGLMPLLSDATWRDLVKHSVALSRGRFELLVGATDLSTRRALDRIDYLNGIVGIDGVVIMAPGGMFKFTPQQYLDYFTTLADASKQPLFLYDLEPLTGVHLSVDTVCRLAEHRNIAGIKLSANVPEAARLQGRLAGSSCRLIVAEPALSDMLFRHGYREQLDGIYAIAPHWAVRLVESAKRESWDEAARWQSKLTAIKEIFLTHPLGPAFTALMNLRGIRGTFAPHPLGGPDDSQLAALKALPIVTELLDQTTRKI
ncbi:dihydrodipicolinate synthase family protein [Phycisphaerales bacterium AB-hyl4]|uniref:Dihydrodipicolinate synthase family protein n=1 Tax=Natronomicrosphaera hydrolytica TaxID=3242702 RepID=A0ABV4U5J7_9BACT